MAEKGDYALLVPSLEESPPQYQEAIKFPPSWTPRILRVFKLILIFFVFFTLICLMVYFFYNIRSKYLNFFDLQQKDSIQFHSKTGDQETWIFKNFETGYQTVRVSTKDFTMCYVSKVPLNDMSKFTKFYDSKFTNNFYQIVPPPETGGKVMKDLIGRTAYTACRGIETKWIEVLETNFTSNGLLDQRAFHDFLEDKEMKNSHNMSNLSREKRNIRSCRTSCCWRVCCCDVHHFIWQVAEEFNCNHVCGSCSKQYKAVVQKIC